MLLDFNIFDPMMQDYLADVLLLNFNWIVTLLVVIGLVLKWRSLLESSRLRQSVFIVVMLATSFYLVTRHRPFNHVRYLVPVFPFLALLMFLVLPHIIKEYAIRMILLAGLCVLYFASNLFSIDPISRAYFGTFSFGTHSQLNMSSHSYPPNSTHPHFVRDELVYNLEYLKLHEMINWIFRDLSIRPQQTIMGSENSRFFWPEFVDSITLERSARHTGVFRPHYFDRVEEFADVVDKPKILYYIEFPSMISPEHFQKLERWYRFVATRAYDDGGYRINVYVFELLADASPIKPDYKS